MTSEIAIESFPVCLKLVSEVSTDTIFSPSDNEGENSAYVHYAQ